MFRLYVCSLVVKWVECVFLVCYIFIEGNGYVNLETCVFGVGGRI